MKALLQDNLRLLEELRSLLLMLSVQQYQKRSALFLESNVAGHARHCIEHYESFLSGVARQCIDYDDRPRCQELEADPLAAVAAVDELKLRMKELAAQPDALSLLVKQDSEAAEGKQSSSLGREYQFLLSHTIHHFALMAGLCLEQRLPVPTDFGVAPSTRKHREKTAHE